MHRRTLLRSIGVAGVASLAGCSSSGRSTGETQPEPRTSGTDGTQSTTTETSTAPTPTDDAGTTITARNDLRLTLSDFVVTDQIVYGDTRKQSGDGKQYFLTRLKVRNNGTESVDPPAQTDFIVEDGSGIRYGALELGGFSYGSDERSYEQPISGSAYQAPRSLKPGKITEGLVAFEAPADISDPTLAAPNLEGEDVDTVAWELSTASSHVVSFDTDVTAPDGNIVQHRQYTYEVTVTNAGGRAGKYESTFSFSGATVLSGSTTVSATLDGGESATQTVTVRVVDDGSFRADFGTETITEATIEPPTNAFGDTWTTPGGLEVTVQNVQFTDGIRYREDNETHTATPNGGRKFLVFEVISRYTGTDDSVGFPEDFTVELPSGTRSDTYDFPLWSRTGRRYRRLAVLAEHIVRLRTGLGRARVGRLYRRSVGLALRRHNRYYMGYRARKPPRFRRMDCLR
ncbi:hypothetical protein [Halomicrococcus sp. NG-SE-24]|uniref:hypothetical protein n=1 Tax=Halomicrococcus sp. NG-SE-24 TaxID=3436928 RepID=UPI003D9852F6